jgi:serine/threonine-protein kinase
MLAAHLYEKPEPVSRHRPDVPADLESVILRCLAKEPAGRYPDAESLELGLAQCQCAGGWGQREAALWWRTHGGSGGPAPGDVDARPDRTR